MKYDEVKRMAEQLRNEVKKFCGGSPVSDYEAECLAFALGCRFWALYGSTCSRDEDGFRRLIENTVRNEIKRACA